jgi:hypothetical protein
LVRRETRDDIALLCARLWNGHGPLNSLAASHFLGSRSWSIGNAIGIGRRTLSE